MTVNKYPQAQQPDPTPKLPGTKEPNSKAALNASEVDFTPCPDEVARKAYFTYLNQGSRDGHEVQHWLAAEAELITERRLTRVHGFHHQA